MVLVFYLVIYYQYFVLVTLNTGQETGIHFKWDTVHQGAPCTNTFIYEYRAIQTSHSTVCSTATSQLQGPRFDPKLRSVLNFSRVSIFSNSQKYACRWISKTKLSLGVNVCAFGLGFYLGCIPAFCLVFQIQTLDFLTGIF